MPSSTRAGVFGMTRTTATPSGSRDSTKLVVIPAASETTVWVGWTAGAISASRSGMSCGFTTRTSVSACFAASMLDTTSTPYRSRSSAARSSRRSVIRRSSGRRPALISPDSNVSPITPAPRTATLLLMSTG